MARGIIQSFDLPGGHGFILSDDGETLFVHRGSIDAEADSMLAPGRRMAFERQLGGMGAQAVEVRPTDADADERRG
jgi:cold shock CspA family protein